MKVTQVSISPSLAANNLNRPALTPELLAAVGARYSRNNEGLDSILSKIDFDNPDKSVDSIFKYVDYGHGSLLQLVPIAMFIDGVSIFAAMTLWYLCPTASGQESSTRYINYKDSECYKINDNSKKLFENYEKAYEFWSELAQEYPSITKIPSDINEKQKSRMLRNFAFDRARVWLPIAACTNVMMIQSAGAWAELITNLLSHPFTELKQLGEQLLSELEISAPRSVKHIYKKKSAERRMNLWIESFNNSNLDINKPALTLESNIKFEISSIIEDLKFRKNRYDDCGDISRMNPILFAIPNITIGEIRDLNRHRTGSKYIDLKPQGFYDTMDCVKDCEKIIGKKIKSSIIKNLGAEGNVLINVVNQYGTEKGIYSLPLGTQLNFRHRTTFDKFIYEAELRTGLGSHYKYCEHFKQLLNILYQSYPEFKGLILEGNAEPE